MAYNIVLPLGWWSFRQYFDSVWAALCTRAYWYVKVIAVLLWSLLICTMRRDSTTMAAAHLVLCLLYTYFIGKELLSWLYGRLLARYSLILRIAVAFILCCAVPVTHSTQASMLHLVCSAMYAYWLWRGAAAFLQFQLQSWVNRVVRATAANVAMWLYVLLYIWYLMLPSGSMASFFNVVVIAKITWACCIILAPHFVVWILATGRLIMVCGEVLARRCSEIPHVVMLVYSSICGCGQWMRQLIPVQDALKLVRSCHALYVSLLGKNVAPTVRRSPRLASKPRVNYKGM